MGRTTRGPGPGASKAPPAANEAAGQEVANEAAGQEAASQEAAANEASGQEYSKIQLKKFDISLSVTYKKCIVMKIGGKQHCLADPV